MKQSSVKDMLGFHHSPPGENKQTDMTQLWVFTNLKLSDADSCYGWKIVSAAAWRSSLVRGPTRQQAHNTKEEIIINDDVL